MSREHSDVTEAELALLQSLWDHGPATIRQLVDRVYEQGGTSVYATVQKLLDRLEAKGCVRRNRTGAVHVFEASIARGDLIGRRLRAVADALCGGALAPLLTQLVEGGDLSARDRQELRSLIDRLDERKRGGGQNRA
ncbi:BlaI/MecI/CopY family transcriptional regulator [Aquisphaera insulae]|uniref:BlaI/MecI/CopY family transcriptional regulator n=1 Tax=Aquisphaera insulae TaxID=2712864 RepID=UPI0013ED528C|nr:BlaI/MecI/CopY family transcriptional regulator [Aquisphaera insulae]